MESQEKNLFKFLNNLFKNSIIEDVTHVPTMEMMIVKINKDGPLLLISNQRKTFRLSPMVLNLINNTFGINDYNYVIELCKKIIYKKFNISLDGYSILE